MSKISIGLRGWRFEESEVFDENGEFLPLEEMPADARTRIHRLTTLVGSPCEACWLIHGDENLSKCDPAAVVYGEPTAEVVLCDDHERDFIYWYREEDGSEFRGEERLEDEFHGWFADGGRAPEEYAGVEHVMTDPANVPNPTTGDDTLDEATEETTDGSDEPSSDLDDEPTLDELDLDLSQDYPS